MKNNPPPIITKEKMPVNINYDEKISDLLVKVETEKQKSQTIDSEKLLQK